MTSRGLSVLERGYVPTLSKLGRTVQMLIGPQEIHFVMTSDNTGDGGPLVSVRLSKDLVFEQDSYLCQSKHKNLIAFDYELKLLERVLHGASANQADALELRLSVRHIPDRSGRDGGGGDTTKPFLTFASRGSNLSVVQELPISKPFVPSDVDRLVRLIESDNVCRFYLDLQPILSRLGGAMDKFRRVADTVQIALVRNGDAHFQASHVHADVGVEYRGLEVVQQSERVVDFEVSVHRILPVHMCDRVRACVSYSFFVPLTANDSFSS